MSGGSREAILARIREALSVKTDDRFLHSRHEAAPADPRACLPPGGDSFEERLARFRTHLGQLRAEFVACANPAEAGIWLHLKAVELGWRRIATHGGALALPLAEAAGLPLVNTSIGYSVGELESCAAAVTECDALVAQTGSILVSSHSAGGRALSVLPPHHVVVATPDQLVEDMTAAFDEAERRHGDHPPSFLSFITGASRTGDIERILVLGAHGPRNLTVLMMESLDAPAMDWMV